MCNSMYVCTQAHTHVHMHTGFPTASQPKELSTLSLVTMTTLWELGLPSNHQCERKKVLWQVLAQYC